MLSLQEREWKTFKIKNLIPEIERGKRLKNEDHIPGQVPYISSSAVDNGVADFVGNTQKVRKFKDCLSLANSGSVGSCFYEPFEFVASDHITHLKKPGLTKYQYLFLATMLSRLNNKYNFNREINDVRISKETILLPITSSGEPDWQFMEDYVRERQDIQNKAQIEYFKNKLDSLGNKKAIPSAEDKSWKSFRMSDLFSISKGNQNKMNLLIPGDIPLISAKNNNNGLKNFVSQNKTIFPSGTISLNCDGDGGVGLSYYQPADYMLDSHCKSLKANQKINEFSLIFISGCISKQRILFSHGRSINDNRAKTLKIMLPINQTRNPDYSYMEQYVKNLMIDKYTQYIKYLES